MSIYGIYASVCRTFIRNTRCNPLHRGRHSTTSIASYPSTSAHELNSSVIVTTLSSLGGLNIKAVDLTNVVREITTQHNCSPLASVALGRTLVGNVLLAAGREDGDMCQVTINGNGPLQNINTEVSFSADVGVVRGYVDNPTVSLPLVRGLLDVSGAVGIGVLKVCRMHPSRPLKAQEGTTMLETSEIGEDLVVYLLNSEQINSALGLGVYIDKHVGHISAAVGFLCTVLPGCSEEELISLENNISRCNLSKLVNDDGKSIDDITTVLTQGLGEQYRIRKRLIKRCSCSDEKFIESFKLLGQKELRDIVYKNEKDESIQCRWCNSVLRVSPQSLKHLLTDEDI